MWGYSPRLKSGKGRADLKHSLRKIKVPLRSLQMMACSKETHVTKAWRILGSAGGTLWGWIQGGERQPLALGSSLTVFPSLPLPARSRRLDASWAIPSTRARAKLKHCHPLLLNESRFLSPPCLELYFSCKISAIKRQGGIRLGWHQGNPRTEQMKSLKRLTVGGYSMF